MLFKGMDNNIDFGELELFTRNETEKKRYELFKKYKNLQRKIQARTDLSDLKKQQELMKNQERLASDLSELPRPVIFADEQPTTTEIKKEVDMLSHQCPFDANFDCDGTFSQLVVLA